MRSVLLLAYSESQTPFCSLGLAFSTWRVLYRHPLGFGPTANQSDWNVHRTVSVAEEGRDLRSERLFEVYINQHIQQLIRNMGLLLMATGINIQTPPSVELNHRSG